MMDHAKLVQSYKATTLPDQREIAEQYLIQMQKIIGFAPETLKVVMDESVEVAARQAAVIYLKNMVAKHWQADSADASAEVLEFTIHEQDRHVIRESILHAVTYSPEPIRAQLAVCVTNILKHDFPAKWPQVVDQISQQLQSTDGHQWMGALTVLYRIVKLYEYRKVKEKRPLIDVFKVLLPLLFERVKALMPDASQESVYLQKLILKIFYGLVQHSLNFEMLSESEFLSWMETVREIVDRPVPDETLTVEESDRAELIWWKCKKWAIRLMARVFERYGSPGQVQSQYSKFADFYLKRFAAPSIETVLKVLDQYRQRIYVSPRVLHQALCYLQSGVSHAFAWKCIKPHFQQIVKDVIFPLLQHDDDDEEMWEDDPAEFVRCKYDVFDELLSAEAAAMSLLSAGMKRKPQLPQTLQFIVGVLTAADAEPRRVDGALHMIGALAPSLLKKKVYRKDLEPMLTTQVIPRLSNEARFVRARACWVIQSYSEVNYSSDRPLTTVIESLLRCVMEDVELPVKVEAALAVQMLLSDQPRAEKIIQPHVQQLVLAVLKLLSEAEIDDLTSVMEKLIRTYMDDIIPVAVEAAQGLANVFAQFLNSEYGGEDRSIAAMGILNTLESILAVMEDHREIMIHLEQIVLQIIQVVIENAVMDFYEEVFSLVHSLTCSQISEPMWNVYSAICEMFKQEGMDYFTDMMPALHNYVTVDTDAFLSHPDRIEKMLQMCQQVLANDDAGDDAQTHAAKLLEVLVLQCRGRIDAQLRPITEMVLARLTTQVKTSELRTMLLQVVISGLHYNTALMLETIKSLQPANSTEPIFDHFVKQWIYDTDCFLGVHDRKVCLIGLCILMSLGDHRPPILVSELAPQVIPSCLMLFDGLQKAYQSQAEARNADSDKEEDSEDEEGKDDGLASDEDEIDEATLEFLERLDKAERDSGNDDEYEGDSDSDDEDDDGIDETDLEAYETPLDGESAQVDEFLLFKQTLFHLEQSDPQWYNALVGNLNESQTKDLQNLVTIADQRKQLADSKMIEESGGYKFEITPQLPTSFNFSGGAV